MKRRFLALIITFFIVVTSITPTIYINGEETTTEESVSEGTVTGAAGDEAGDDAKWVFDYATSTLTFSGKYIEYSRCSEIDDLVKYIVFEEGVEMVFLSSGWGNSIFPNLESIHYPTTLRLYLFSDLDKCKNLTSITVAEGNKGFGSFNGDFYLKSNGEINDLVQYAVGKKDKTFVIPEGVTEIREGSLNGADNLEEVVLPKSITTIELPFTGCNIKKLTVLNPDCILDFNEVEDVTVSAYKYSNVEKQCHQKDIDFEVLEVKPAKEVSVSTLPSNLEIVEGRKYVPNGLKLNVTYENGTKEIVYCGYEYSVDTSTVGERMVTVTFGGATTNFAINVIDVPETDIIDVGDTIWTEVNSSTAYKDYYFTPKISGVYRFHSSGGVDPWGEILDIGENLVVFQDDVIDEEGRVISSQFSIEQELEAGKTYILRAGSSGSQYKFFVSLSLVYTLTDCVHSSWTKIETKEPTCSDEGYSIYECDICEETKISDYTVKVSHEFEERVILKVPTCTENGYSIYKCKNCSTAIIKDITDVLGHDYTDTVILPTPTDYGYTLHECGRCTNSFKTNWTDPVVIETEEPTTEPETTTKQTETTKKQQKGGEKTTVVVEKLAKPKVKAKRSGNKIKLTLSSKNKGVKYQIFIKKNGKYKRLKTTKKKNVVFKYAKKCHIKVRTIKYNGSRRIYSEFRKISI